MRGTKFKPKTQVLITSLHNEDIFSKVMVDFTPWDKDRHYFLFKYENKTAERDQILG